MRRAPIIIILLLLLTPAVGYADKPFEFDTNARVVAFADVHGAYDSLVQLLQEANVIDANTDWSGGNTHLVSTGDWIDRGRDSRKVLELLMKLDKQSAAAGGALHATLGNHEVMVMSGDWRYISAAEYAAFQDQETGAEREALLDEYRVGNPDMSEEELRLRFEKFHPPGFLGLQRAYAPDGELGQWLLQLPLVLRVNDTLYMHGGISSAIAEQSLADINGNNKAELKKYLALVESLRNEGVLSRYVDFWGRRVYLNTKAEAIVAADPKARPDWFQTFIDLAELEGAFVFGDKSPIWYRGTAYCHPYSESFNTERLLKRTGTKRVVLGHTPNPTGVVERMDGLAILLDTGMLASVYKGRGSLLVQEGENRYVQYLGSPDHKQPLVMDRSLTRALSGMSDTEMETLLLRGNILEVIDIGTGLTNPKRVTLSKDGMETYAVFKHEDTDPGLEKRKRFVNRKHNESDRFVYDVAGYKLDRMIDLQLVPVTVLRPVEGEEGALGAWVNNAITETERLEVQKTFSGYCAQMEQYRLRILFDILIFNWDRNMGNIMWNKSDNMLRLIDHSRAFRSTEKRPKQYRKSKNGKQVVLQLSDLFRRHLEEVSRQQLDAELSAYLHPRQIEAIMARRDLILKEAAGTAP